jgi:hypothetical protein
MIDFASLDLDKLESIAKAADQTEWKVDFFDNGAVFNIDSADGQRSIGMAHQLPGDDVKNSLRRANAQHMANFSPSVVLALIAELKKAKAGA